MARVSIKFPNHDQYKFYFGHHFDEATGVVDGSKLTGSMIVAFTLDKSEDFDKAIRLLQIAKHCLPLSLNEQSGKSNY